MRDPLAPNQTPRSTTSPIAMRDFLYPSNLLSMMRLGLSPFLFYSIRHSHQLMTLTIGGLAILSDALDGYLARRLNQHSNLGKILDPIADKVAIGCVILGLILAHRGFPIWAFGIVMVRDILIVLANVVLFRQTRIIARSNLWGKCTTFFLSVAMILYVLIRHVSIPPSLPFYVLCVSLVFLLISSWSYSRQLLRILQQSEPPPNRLDQKGIRKS